jgi:hypothetical protein
MNSIIKASLMLVTLSMLTACGLDNASKEQSKYKCIAYEYACWKNDDIYGPVSTIEYSSKNRGMFHFKITQDAQNVFTMNMKKTKTLANDYSFTLKNLTQEQQTQLSNYFAGKTRIEGSRHWTGPADMRPTGDVLPPNEVKTLNVQMKGHSEFTLSKDSALENLILDIYYQNLGSDIAYELKSGSYNLTFRVCYNKSPKGDELFWVTPQDALNLKTDSLTLDINVANKTGVRTLNLVSHNTVEIENLTFTDKDLQAWSRTIKKDSYGYMKITIVSEVMTQEGGSCPVGYSMISTLEEQIAN